MTKQTTHPVTFNPEPLKAVLDQAVAAALAKHDAKSKPTIAANSNSKAPQNAAQMDQRVVKAFRRAGFTDAQPRLNVLTYRKWLEQGYRVKPGEKSVKVAQFRLFHASQTQPFNPSTERTVVPLKPKKGKKAAKAPAAAPVQPELPIGA